MAETTVYHLKATCEECVAEFYINGAAITRNSRTYPFLVYPSISEWLVDGKNELSIRIDRVSDGALAEGGPGAAQAALSLCRAELGTYIEPDEEDEIFGVEWESTEEGLELPATARVTGEVRHEFGMWAWELADRLTDDAETRRSIAALVGDLHRTLSARQVEPFLERMTLKFDEISRCYGKTRHAMNQEARQGLPEVWRHPAWAMAPFEAEGMQLRLCCGGRVAEVRARDGGVPLRQLEAIDDETWGLGLFVARINGVFTVVR